MIARSTVEAGENIVSIASRLLGDPMRWLELAQLNKLRAPYITREPSPGRLSPGEVILYPSLTATPVPAGVNTDRLDSATYKRDLTAENGDLVLQGGTLQSEVGLPNLRTAISRRLSTLIGRHPFHPGYGSLLYTHIGAVADGPRLSLLLVDAKRAVLTDPRVTSVTGTAEWDNERVTLDLLIVPILPGEPFRFVDYY